MLLRGRPRLSTARRSRSSRSALTGVVAGPRVGLLAVLLHRRRLLICRRTRDIGGCCVRCRYCAQYGGRAVLSAALVFSGAASAALRVGGFIRATRWGIRNRVGRRRRTW